MPTKRRSAPRRLCNAGKIVQKGGGSAHPLRGKPLLAQRSPTSHLLSLQDTSEGSRWRQTGPAWGRPVPSPHLPSADSLPSELQRHVLLLWS